MTKNQIEIKMSVPKTKTPKTWITAVVFVFVIVGLLAASNFVGSGLTGSSTVGICGDGICSKAENCPQDCGIIANGSTGETVTGGVAISTQGLVTVMSIIVLACGALFYGVKVWKSKK